MGVLRRDKQREPFHPLNISSDRVTPGIYHPIKHRETTGLT